MVGNTHRTIVIRVGDPLNGSATATLTGCNEVTFVSNASGNGLQYAWSGDDNLSGNQATLVHTYSTPGWHQYEVLVSNPGGCGELVVDSIYVPGPGSPTITRTGDFLIAPPSTSYQWYLNGQPLPGVTTGSHLATACGEYSVEVQSNLCTVLTQPIQVSLTQLPTISITPWGSNQFCQGDSVMLDAGAGFTDYQWSTGATTRTIMAYNDGYYTVSAVKNGCEVSAAPFQVIVHPLPVPTITDLGGNLLESSPAMTYQWKLNGVPIPGATTATYQATQFGDYTVSVHNVYGCLGTSSPYTYENTTDLDNSVSGWVRLYPNPAHDWVRLEYLNSSQHWTVILLKDLHGRTLESFDMGNCPHSCNLTLDLDGLRSGIYFIELRGAAVSKTLKFVKY